MKGLRTYMANNHRIDGATHASLIVLILETAHALCDGRVFFGLDGGVAGWSAEEEGGK